MGWSWHCNTESEKKVKVEYKKKYSDMGGYAIETVISAASRIRETLERRQQGSPIDGKNHSDTEELEIVKEIKCFHCLTIYNGKFRTDV